MSLCPGGGRGSNGTSPALNYPHHHQQSFMDLSSAAAAYRYNRNVMEYYSCKVEHVTREAFRSKKCLVHREASRSKKWLVPREASRFKKGSSRNPIPKTSNFKSTFKNKDKNVCQSMLDTL